MSNDCEKLTLVIGGTRSGKSVYAESLISGDESKVLYVATAEVWEGEGSMAERIRKHISRRPSNWDTLECPVNLAENIGRKLKEADYSTVLIECITMFTSNVMFQMPSESTPETLEKALEHEMESLMELIQSSRMRWIIVSGETGLGLTPPNKVTQLYCDVLGMVNQFLASRADKTVLVIAGKSLELK